MRRKSRPTTSSIPSSLKMLKHRMSHPTTRRRMRPGDSWLTNVYWLSTHRHSEPGVPRSDRKDLRPTAKQKHSELSNALTKLSASSYRSSSKFEADHVDHLVHVSSKLLRRNEAAKSAKKQRHRHIYPRCSDPSTGLHSRSKGAPRLVLLSRYPDNHPLWPLVRIRLRYTAEGHPPCQAAGAGQ
jgi:hypothetical protein